MDVSPAFEHKLAVVNGEEGGHGAKHTSRWRRSTIRMLKVEVNETGGWLDAHSRLLRGLKASPGIDVSTKSPASAARCVCASAGKDRMVEHRSLSSWPNQVMASPPKHANDRAPAPRAPTVLIDARGDAGVIGLRRRSHRRHRQRARNDKPKPKPKRTTGRKKVLRYSDSPPVTPTCCKRRRIPMATTNNPITIGEVAVRVDPGADQQVRNRASPPVSAG